MSVNIEEPIMPPEEVQIKFVVPTVEESIERLGFMAGKMGYPDSSAARRGKNALKKEIPMSDHYTGVCAKCGERVKTNEIYCHRCGQKQPKAVYKGKLEDDGDRGGKRKKMKLTIVINGRGGVGKDTMCEAAGKLFKTMVVSSIDPIKQAAKFLGWEGQKEPDDRRFISYLKELSIHYNNYPTQYLEGKYREFMDSDAEILFVHIREPKEIRKFLDAVHGKAITLLITRPGFGAHYGNQADDNVDDFLYDYQYRNDQPLEQSKNHFLAFLGELMVKAAES